MVDGGVDIKCAVCYMTENTLVLSSPQVPRRVALDG